MDKNHKSKTTTTGFTNSIKFQFHKMKLRHFITETETLASYITE